MDCIWNVEGRCAVEEFDVWYCYLVERVPEAHRITQPISSDTSNLLNSFRAWIRKDMEHLRRNFKEWFAEFNSVNV